MKIQFRASFKRDLKKINDKEVLRLIKKEVKKIESAETVHQVGNMIRLRSKADFYRIRIGHYRIGLKLQENVVHFVRILHRKDIYRYFP